MKRAFLLIHVRDSELSFNTLPLSNVVQISTGFSVAPTDFTPYHGLAQYPV